MKETPKEKAKQLIQKFELIDREQRYQDELNLFEAKQCALICVDEMLKMDLKLFDIVELQEVKREINKL